MSEAELAEFLKEQIHRRWKLERYIRCEPAKARYAPDRVRLRKKTAGEQFPIPSPDPYPDPVT